MFKALADPTRRKMLEHLDDGPATVTTLAEPFDVSLTAITQHVRVLERCGLVRSEKHGRQRTCELDRDALAVAQGWIEQRRRNWDRRLDRLERQLDDARTDPPSIT